MDSLPGPDLSTPISWGETRDLPTGEAPCLAGTDAPAVASREVPQAVDVMPLQPPLNPAPLQPQAEAASTPPTAKPSGVSLIPPFSIPEWLLAASYTLAGFLFFECELYYGYFCGLGTTLFFLLMLGSTLTYLLYRNIAMNAGSWFLFAVALTGAFPYVLFGRVTTYPLSLLFESSLCLLWLAYSCQSLIARPLSWLVAFDWINTCFVVPAKNLLMVFRQHLAVAKNSRLWQTVLVVPIAMVISLPLLFLVVNLLVQSDAAFETLVNKIADQISLSTVNRAIFNYILGLPLAVYMLATVHGSRLNRYTDVFRREKLLSAFSNKHCVPRIAVVIPLCMFILVYLLYLVVMSSYLFSALNGTLPASFTYSEYARRGFAELVRVAAINAFILAIVWIIGQREKEQYPMVFRVLSALLVVITLIMIVTAASKMLLYVQAYGLTLLRFYTSWFMVTLAICFLMVLVWCFMPTKRLKPKNIARPIIATLIGSMLVLQLICPTALIANFNVERYLSGQTDKVDILTIGEYGRTALPALHRLQKEAPERQVREGADRYIQGIVYQPNIRLPWYYWNLSDQLSGVYHYSSPFALPGDSVSSPEKR